MLVVKNPPANSGDARDLGSIPGSGRFPGEGNGNPLQYCCLGNPMDRGAWQATVHGVAKSDMTEHTCVCTHTHTCWTSQNMSHGGNNHRKQNPPKYVLSGKWHSMKRLRWSQVAFYPKLFCTI